MGMPASGVVPRSRLGEVLAEIGRLCQRERWRLVSWNIDKLNKEINAGLADPKIKARVADMGGTTFKVSVIQDGKIVAVGKTVTVPSGAKVLDLKGLHVYPGFFDAGSQVGMS